jgi:hypothetical protein
MKGITLISLLLLGAAMSLSHGQEATDADLQTQKVNKKPEPESPAPPNLPERTQIDEIFRQTSLGKAADERRLHLEWRELANQIGNDPHIIEAKKHAEAASTDLEKRRRLRDYYELYYGRLRSLASSAEMKDALDKLKLAHVSRTAQPRVRPEYDANLPTPTPGPQKQKAKKHSWERGEGG